MPQRPRIKKPTKIVSHFIYFAPGTEKVQMLQDNEFLYINVLYNKIKYFVT